MAKRKIETEFSITGEEAYKQALSEINSGMSVLKSEMRLVAAEFEGNADSIEALTKKHDILGKQHELQKKKVEELEKALTDANEALEKSGGKSQKAAYDVDEYQKKVNYAKAELFKLAHQLADTNAAMEEAAKSTENGTEKFRLFSGEAMGLGDVLDKVSDKLGVRLPNGMTQTLNGLGKVNPAAAVAAGGFAALAAAVTKAEDALRDLTLESATYADNILTLSNNTGLSTVALQEWSYAAELIDVSMDTVNGSMVKMIRSMNGARDGTGAAKDTFDALGLSITNVDGTLRNSEDVFFDVIDALGKIENGTERDAMSMEIFGKSAQDLNSLIVQGSGTLKKYTDEAHEMGYVLSGEALDALGAVDDAQQRLLRTQEAVSNQISAEYAPYMEESLTMTRERIQDIGKALTESGAVEAFGSILVSTQSLLRPLAELGMEILPPLAKILGGIAGVMALIADAANVIAGLVTLDFRRIGTALGFNPDQASNMQIWMHGADYKADRWGSAYGNAFDESTGLYSGNYFHASGTDNFPGGWSWVGENGPEKVYLPQGTQIATAQESRNSERNEFNFYIEARSLRELEDLLRIVEDARRMRRMKG
nr:MAG TPA: tail tape measure [Caudoviricetes sp.]